MRGDKETIILNVDDHEANRYARSRVLRQAGFEVLEACTGTEALRLVESHKPQLVLLDVNLPDTTGYEVCRKLKTGSSTSGILVLHVSTTYVKGSDQTRGLEGGADGYLTEPVDPEVLIATVNAFLRLRRAEKALRESEERFRGAFEDAPIGMALVNLNYKIFHANKTLSEMLGYTPHELSDLCVSELTFDEDREKDAELIRQLFEGKIPNYSLEKRCLTKKGEVVWINLTATALKGSEGEILHGLLMVEDITERKHAEENRQKFLSAEQKARKDAEAASRAKDEFLAVVSHELRTPLGAILGWARLLSTEKLDSEATARGLEIIASNAKSQAQLIDDILDVSSIISGKLRLNAQRVELGPIIQTAVDSVIPAATAKGIQLHVVLSPELAPVLGDPTRLQQIVWNLLSNSVKFTRKGEQIEVHLAKLTSSVEITVSDTGQGIPSEFIPHVFEAFRQADSSTTRKQQGLGIGLSIVRHLVELHGGTIQAFSSGEGKGSTFKLVLPLMDVEAPRTAVAQRSEEIEVTPQSSPEWPRHLAGVQVLLVDDDPDAREILTLILEKGGAKVNAASSASEAMQVLRSWHPDLILADIGMPEQNGYSLLHQVRDLKPEQGGMIPALALTAYASRQDRSLALLAGFQEHLVKPVEPVELLRTIASLLGKTR